MACFPSVGRRLFAIAAVAIGFAGASQAADPCKLLTDADVRSVFPGASSGKLERSREKYGIQACQWAHPSGSFALQLWTAKKPGDHDGEVRGLAQGIVDPFNAKAKKAMRYETINGIGDGATALVEAAGKPSGVLNDMAMIVVQRGNQLLQMQSSDLARGDRAAALQALTRLARAATERL